MATQNASWIEKLRAPPRWVRGLYVAALALILLGNLALITFNWGGTRIYVTLSFLWFLALVALLFLLRIWRATFSPRR